MKFPQFAPSILSADFSNMTIPIGLIEKSALEIIHIDVMDGNFVPNLTFGPKFIRDIRKLSTKIFDCHLMIEDPSRYVEEYADAGADWLTIHAESEIHIHRTCQAIKKRGLKCGISIVPSTPVSMIEPILDMIDLALVMTVNPGFGGQEMIKESLAKVSVLDRMRKEKDLDFMISIDGGVNRTTIADVQKLNPDIIVVGSAFFGSNNPLGEVEFFESHWK